MMNSLIRIQRFHRITPQRFASTKSTGGNKKDEKVTRKKGSSSLGQLQGLVSKMKVSKAPTVFESLSKFGNSDTFNYATNKQYKRDELKSDDSQLWNKLVHMDVVRSCINLPLNGFQEMILLTEQGRMWRYPIDNEQGLEEEKEVPFEEHVFLDHLLEDFPQNEYIQSFMGFIVSGLARNHWMTVDRKHEIIKFYKEYFNDKRQMYKDRGFEI